MVTLYIETNYLMSIAKGQDPRAMSLLAGDDSRVRLAVPSICFMEALFTFEKGRGQRNVFTQFLSDQIREVGRDSTADSARELHRYLTTAKIAWEGYQNDIVNRLDDCMVRLAQAAEIIALPAKAISDSIDRQIITGPADNLILHQQFPAT